MFSRDNVQDTTPQKKHGLGSSFLVENLLNACPIDLAIEKPLTGFSDLQEQIEIGDRQIQLDSETELSDSLPSDSNFESSSGEESGGERNDIVDLFKEEKS